MACLRRPGAARTRQGRDATAPSISSKTEESDNTRVSHEASAIQLLKNVVQIVFRALLAILFVAGILLTLLLAAATFDGPFEPGKIVVGILAAVVGTSTLILVLYFHRRQNRLQKANIPREHPILRYVELLFLGVIINVGMLFTIFSINENLTVALVYLSLGSIVPAFVLRERARPSIRSTGFVETGAQFFAECVNSKCTTKSFARSTSELAFLMFICGFLILMTLLPASTSYVLFLNFMSSLDWIALLFSFLSAFLVCGIMFILAICYYFVRDRHLPLLVLDEAGLHLYNEKKQMIPWDQVKTVRRSYSNGIPIMHVSLVNPYHYISRSSIWLSRELSFSLGLLSGPADEVIKAIREHPRYRGD